MILELGPVDAGDVQQWARYVRRVVSELRLDPSDLAGVATPEFLEACSRGIDRWDHHAALGGPEFRWSSEIDPEVAEYFLHGLDRCLHSPALEGRITEEERQAHRPFTMHVVQALVDGLSAEGRCSQHLCDQVRASLGEALDH